MLVLSRQRGETVMIGDDIDVTIIDVRGEKVRLGINAPRDVSVHRKEIYEQIKEQNKAAAKLQPSDISKLPPKPSPVSIGAAVPTPESSGLFSVWKDPASGVESFVLKQHVAPVQQSALSAGSPFSNDGRFLWFYCAFPPGGDQGYGRMLGVVDFQAGEVRHFPETQFGQASVLIDGESGDALWCTGPEVYRRPAKAQGSAALVARLEAAGADPSPSIASRLSRSADGKFLSFDAALDETYQVGALAIDGSGARIWHTFDTAVRAQFSPTQADTMLVFSEDGRLWILRPQEEPQPLASRTGSRSIRQAWWAPDGKGVYVVDAQSGLSRIEIATGQERIIAAQATGRAHVSANGQAVVADWGSRVAFLNLATGKAVNIVAHMPAPPEATLRYNPSPAPQFCLQDRYISYSTTVHSRVDVALASSESLLALTR